MSEQSGNEPVGRRLSPGERIVFRSAPVMRTSVLLTILLVAAAALIWNAMGPAIRAQFTWPQVATLLFFIAFMAALMLSIGFSQAVATSEGLRVRNVVVTKFFPWDDLLGVNLRSGESWANLEHRVADGDQDTTMLLAIQRAEGEGAFERVAELQALIEANRASSTPVTSED